MDIIRIKYFIRLFLWILPFMVLGQESWSARMAESVMQRHPNVYGNWNYVTGTVLRGFEELWKATGDDQYYNYIQSTVDYVVNENGTIDDYNLSSYNIDEINEGRMVLFMYKNTGLEKYKTAAELLRSQLEDHPRTSEGGFWHKQRYPWQMWLDGLYMGSPFYTEYGLIFDKVEAFDDVVLQLTQMEKHGRDSITGLLYHGWDESREQTWSDPATGQSLNFWGRGIGWYAMALVDVLDFLPSDHADRDSVIRIIERLAEAMFNYQDESGLWWQVVDKGDSAGNYLESSVSCMMVYSMAKAIRFGYIDEAYLPDILLAYEGILDQFITVDADSSIDLIQTCCTAGLGGSPYRDGSYDYYVYQTNICVNDGKAVGPFITGSLEIERLSMPKNFSAVTISGSSIKLSWKNPENSFEGYQVQRSSGSGFTEIDRISIEDSVYTDTELDALTIYSYRIRPYIGGQYGLFSEVIQASTLGTNGEPAYPLNPSPADGAIDEDQDVQLNWDAGAAASSHNVYFSDSNPPAFVGNQAETIFNPGYLDELTSYFWRIDEINNAGTTTGTVWAFTTKSAPLPPDQVADWPFDDGSGSIVVDVTEHGNNATMINMDESAWQTGTVGTALMFDGIDDYVSVPHQDVFNFGENAFSISFWIKQTVQDKHMRYIIKGTHSDPGSGKRYEVFHHQNNVVRFPIDDDNVKSVAEVPNTNFVTGKWVHVVAIRDIELDLIKIYSNTELLSSSADNTGNISQEEDLLFGVSPDEVNTYYEGLMDEFKLYNYAISDSIIEALYTEGLTNIEYYSNRELPINLSLNNYPNPFNPVTTVLYSIPVTGETALTIFNALGQEVEVIFRKKMNKGKYTINYDASHLSTGIYFFNLRTSDRTKSQKFVLVK